MFANRISYWLNVKGPSLGIDEIDCSSFVALEQAISAINRGDCEAAIVGGACLNLNPHASIYHKRYIKYNLSCVTRNTLYQRLIYVWLLTKPAICNVEYLKYTLREL